MLPTFQPSLLPIDRKLNSRPFELKPSGSTYQPRPPLQVTLGYSLLSHSIVEIDSVAANRSASVDSFTEKIAISSVVRPEDTVTEQVPHRYSHGTHNRTPTFDIESGSHFRENRELPRNPESAATSVPAVTIKDSCTQNILTDHILGARILTLKRKASNALESGWRPCV